MTRPRKLVFYMALHLTVFAVAVPAVWRQTPAAEQKAPAAPQKATTPDESAPPEEDEAVMPEKVPLNPMESERSIKVGNYYWKKGKFRAALQRYELAVRYNPSSPEAYFKVAETEEKLKNADAAKIAFEKVIKLAPESKLAQEAKKKLNKQG